MSARSGLRVLVQLLIAVASLCFLLAIYFFWLLVPLAGIVLYVLVQWTFTRRGRRRTQTLRALRLQREAEARAYDLQRSSGS
jgi:ABC-type bacteriocin/lantibiotic exporter with double-glycine peptidase domain